MKIKAGVFEKEMPFVSDISRCSAARARSWNQKRQVIFVAMLAQTRRVLTSNPLPLLIGGLIVVAVILLIGSLFDDNGS